MKNILVLVEGQTEERFVKEVLQQHLLDLDLWITPIVLRNSGDGLPVRKGGVSSWSRMHRDLRHLSQDTSIIAITTLLDYYALPADVPGMSTRPGHLKRRAQVAHVEAAMDSAVDDHSFRAYLSLHELEALLFADIDRWAGRFEEQEIAALKAEIGDQEPEDINDGPATAPSKRLERHLSRYRKTQHGPACANDLGLPLIRSRCPHFDEWITWLEAL